MKLLNTNTFLSKMTLLQKEVLAWLILGLVITVSSGIYIGNTQSEYEGILRFHVIANSDSKEDQEVKLKVRDKVVGTIEEEVSREIGRSNRKDTIGFTKEYVKNHLDEIQRMSEQTIKENGFNYLVRTKLGVTYIPEKTYGDMTFPAGNYEALNIVLGKGEGHNWWCVIFPPLCLVESNSPDSIVLKSKIKEIMDAQQ